MQYVLDTNQQEMFMRIISGILPHKNFNPEIAGDIIEELDNFIDISELYGIQYVFWNIIKNKRVITLYRSNYNKALTYDVFQRAITVGIEEYVTRPAFKAEQLFLDYGLEFNLELQTQREEACNFVYSKLLEEYTNCFNMAIDSAQAYSEIYALKEDVQRSIASLMTSLLGQILTEGIFYKNRNYQGYNDWVSFLPKIENEINKRFINDSNSKRYSAERLNTYENSISYDSKNALDVKHLYYSGFEVYDNSFSFRTQDIVIYIANEGVGKTRLVIDQMHKMLMSGLNVLICCGETHKLKIKKLLEAYHAYYKYQLIFTQEEILDPSKIKGYDNSGNVSDEQTEDLLVKLNLATMDLYQNPEYGKITIVQNLVYEKCEQQITDIVKRDNINVVIIDHVAALDFTGEYVRGQKLSNPNERISHLFRVEDLLVKELNIMFVNTSHTNNSTSEALLKNKEIGVRAGANSSDTTKFASFAFLVTQPKQLKKNDQIVLDILKIRDWPSDIDTIVLTRNGANVHEYYEEQQYIIKGDVKINDDIENYY